MGSEESGQQPLEWTFPQATMRYESQGVLLTQLLGSDKLDVETVAGIRDVLWEFQRPGLFWLLEVGRIPGLTDAAREMVRTTWKPVTCAGFVVFGGSLLARASLQLVYRGLYLIGRVKVSMDVVATEAEARALVAERQRSAS